MIPCDSSQMNDTVSVVFAPCGQPGGLPVPVRGVIDAGPATDGSHLEKCSGHFNRCSRAVVFSVIWRYAEDISRATMCIRYSVILF